MGNVIKMIKKQYLIDCKGLDKYGTCVSCGKNSEDDCKMTRYIFSYKGKHLQHITSICLCEKCKKLFYKDL